jgi:hypothetical protein
VASNTEQRVACSAPALSLLLFVVFIVVCIEIQIRITKLTPKKLATIEDTVRFATAAFARSSIPLLFTAAQEPPIVSESVCWTTILTLPLVS